MKCEDICLYCCMEWKPRTVSSVCSFFFVWIREPRSTTLSSSSPASEVYRRQGGATAESPWVFGDASRLHDLKRPSLFRRDEVPARNTHKIVRLRLYAPKKVFEGSKGRFFKNAPWQGVGQRPTKRGKACTTGHAFSGGTKSLHETPTRLSGFAFKNLKKFLRVPRGVFSKTRPWQGVGQRPTESEKACPTGHAFSGGTRFLHETPTDRPALPLRSEKSF